MSDAIQNKKIIGIIPTLNRHDDLKRLFQSVANIESDTNINFEIVVIDNSSDANAQTIIEQIEIPYPLHYIHEKNKGLSHARNAALKAFTDECDYFCTIDDDLVLPVNYLHAICNTINTFPNAGLIGGRVELYNKLDLPITIKTSMQVEQYAGGMNIFGFIHGCCMLIDSQTVKNIGYFDINLGAGTHCGSAEDTDYFYRIWALSKDIVYTPDWHVHHNHGRRTTVEHYNLRRNYQIGQGAFFCKYKHEREVMRLAYWELSADLKFAIKNVFSCMWFNKLKECEKLRLIIAKWKHRFIGYKNYKAVRKQY